MSVLRAQVESGASYDDPSEGPDLHFSIDVGSMREAHAILTNWAFEIPQVPTLEWTRVEF